MRPTRRQTTEQMWATHWKTKEPTNSHPMSLAFLSTRLSDPREQDWNKLRRVLQYINGTISLPRIFSHHWRDSFEVLKPLFPHQVSCQLDDIQAVMAEADFLAFFKTRMISETLTMSLPLLLTSLPRTIKEPPFLVDNGTLEHNLFLAANLNSTLAAAVPVQDDFLDFDDADQLNQGISVNQGDVLFQGADMENAVEDQGARRENQFVVKTSGVKTPFLHFLKALYRCVKSALFWCNVSASTLTDVGYTTSTLTDVGYKTSVDFSFVVPPDSNTHTGGAVSLGLDTFKNTENQVFNRG
ncbi:hypothetical protein IV203_027001 [Nitzschia inconspicua]|uniref:Uncharacterized protein n=1 Tax=Nitzschia inconspicua TaxID=303405 RepID=A0A9K3PY69_9STRA|nr:hypothetical protein IV203_027001 [Nitzschia inconspicua]